MNLANKAASWVLGARIALAVVLADALDDVMKTGGLKAAVPQDFPPFGSQPVNERL